MKDLKKRLEALERAAFFKENQVCVLHPTQDGRWQMHVNEKLKFYETEEEGIADYQKNTGNDSILIIWDI